MPLGAQYAQSMSDLIQRQGAVRADAAQRKGALWGQAISSFGELPLQLRQAHLWKQAQAAELGLKDEDRARQGALTDAQIRNLNADNTRADAAALTAQQTAELDQLGKRLEITGRTLAGVTDQPSYDAALGELQQSQIDTASFPKVYSPGTIKSAVVRVKGLAQELDALRPKTDLHNVPPGNAVLDEQNPSAGPVFTAPPADRPPVNPTEASLAAAAAAGDPNAARALQLLRQQHPIQGPQPQYLWAKDANGVVRRMTEAEARAPGVEQPDTAGMRDKATGKRVAGKAVAAVRALGKRVITKIGPAQRADAIERGVEAVFGTDPEFRTYQDARMAVAGTLAVEQQGARISDADVKALWLPMIPDAYRDTSESQDLKWGLIDEMRGVTPAGDTKPIVVTAPDGTKHPFATQAEADRFKQLAGIK